MTTFTIEVEEDIPMHIAESILSDMEEIIAKKSYSLYDSNIEHDCDDEPPM